MADKKISELDAITGASTAADDYFVVVDTSGSVTKKISRAELNNAIEQDVLAQVSITDLGSDLNTNGNNILFGDGDKSIFGAGSDLQIYHDSSASYIVDSGTGSLNIHGTDINLKDADGNSYINMSDNGTGGTVTIRHNTAVKLNTKTDGVLITGELQADSLDINGSADIAGTAKSDLVVVDSTGGATPTYSHTNNGEGITLRYNDDSGARAADIVAIGNNPAGATMAMRFFLNPNSTDAAAEVMRIQNGKVGIGTTAPSYKLHSQTSVGSDFAGYFYNSAGSGNGTSLVARGGANNSTANFQVQDYSGNADFTVTGTGKVGIGTASPPQKFVVSNAGADNIVMCENSSASIQMFMQATSGTGSVGTLTNHDVQFLANNSEKMRILSNGNVGIGTASASQKLTVEGTANNQNSEIKITASGVASGYLGSNSNGLNIGTDSHGIVFKTGVTGGGSVGATGSEAMRIDSSSRVLTFKTASGLANAGVEHNFTNAGGYLGVTSEATSVYINRAPSDGTLIQFRQNNSAEGSISVSGTTVSYNGGHLSRWSQLTSNTRDDAIVKGTVMTNLDQMAEWTDESVTEENEQLNCMAVSSVEGDANVAGVFVNWDNDDDIYTNDMNVAMTGDMIIRIAQGTTVARGDLLMSAGDGTAKPQGDDIVRSKTIAKVTSTNVSHTYDDGSYCVPCVLMAC